VEKIRRVGHQRVRSQVRCRDCGHIRKYLSRPTGGVATLTAVLLAQGSRGSGTPSGGGFGGPDAVPDEKGLVQT